MPAALADPLLPPWQIAVARAAEVERLRLRLARGDYPLSAQAIADALIAHGVATGELSTAMPAAQRVIATALVVDAVAGLSMATAMGLQLALVEQLSDNAIAPLLDTDAAQLVMDRKAAFAALRARLAG